MFGRSENEKQTDKQIDKPVDPNRTAPRTETVAPKPPGEKSMIGSSLRIKGEVDGAEDLLIEGCVEGTVTLKQNRLTVGRGGRVQADIFAKTIIVEGEVTGDLHGAESVAILKSGIVKGNIKAPRVTLEDGARIKGSIDTDPAQGEFQSVAGVGAPKPAPKPEEPAKPTNANGARAPMQ